MLPRAFATEIFCSMEVSKPLECLQVNSIEGGQ